MIPLTLPLIEQKILILDCISAKVGTVAEVIINANDGTSGLVVFDTRSAS